MEKSKLKLVGLALAGLGVAMTNTVMAASPVKVGGLIQTDYISFHNDNNTSGSKGWTDEFNSSMTLRRAGFYFKGEIDDCWSYQINWDVDQATWDDTWIGFAGFEPVWLAVGRITPVQGLENWMSSTATTFMERASVSAFAPPSGLGVYAEGTTGVVAYAASLSFPDNGVTGLSTTDPYLIAGRITFAPTETDTSVLHFGASYNMGEIDHNFASNLTVTPALTGRAGTTLLTSVGTTSGINLAEGEDFHNWGLEAAGEWGPLLVMGEYQEYELNGRSGNGDAEFDGWYVDVAYVLTGESRSYDQASGTFGRVNPESNTGAWEVALRYDTIDMDDRPTGWATNSQIGKMHQWVAGVNWYVNNSVKLVANYAHSEADYFSGSTRSDRDLDIFGIRAQLRF